MSITRVYLTFIVALFAISSANGNYGYGQQYGQQALCNRNVFDRAQNMIRNEIQTRASNQPPYNNPSFSGMTNGYQSNTQYSNQQQMLEQQCRSVRISFNDLVINTPLCESMGNYGFSTATLIEQGRQFMQKHCERNQGYPYMSCYKSTDLYNCETMYSNDRNRIRNVQPNNNPNMHLLELCPTYETFRNCVMTVITRNCIPSDSEYVYTYLFDRAHNLAWSCVPNQNVIVGSYQPMNNYPPRTDIAISNQGYYPSRTDNFGVNYPVVGSNSQFSSRAFPTYQQAGNVPMSPVDRSQLERTGYTIGTEACLIKVKPFENACTNLLVQRQREARYGRSSNDVERRICCALYYHRDCLSRVVLEHCPESTRIVVDLLMGDRQREITTNCHSYSREQCNGVTSLQGSLLLLLVATLSIVKLFY